MRIFKYTLDEDCQTSATQFRFDLPQGSKILHFGIQHDQFCIWCEVDPDAPPKQYVFEIAPTGGHAPPELDYIGTAFTDAAGTYVFHLYGRINRPRPV